MMNVLVRGVPDEVMAAVDAKASRVGLTRNEYLRRLLLQEVATSASPVTTADLSWFSDVFVDLGDPEVMRGAWE